MSRRSETDGKTDIESLAYVIRTGGYTAPRKDYAWPKRQREVARVIREIRGNRHHCAKKPVSLPKLKCLEGEQ